MMLSILQVLFALALAGVILVRAVCVVYHAHHTTHARGATHFLGFGYSYIALGSAAAVAVLAITCKPELLQLVVWLFLIASAGMILFDRRPRR